MKPIRFHPYLQRDIDDALNKYNSISEGLGDRFWNEFCFAIHDIQRMPEKHHVDQFTGYRRYNMDRFPYNILYILYPDRIRIQVIRHNKRRESFGAYRKRL